MAIRTELSLRLANMPGTLRDLCDVLGDAQVNLVALQLDSNGRLRLLVDNPLLAADALRQRQMSVEQHDVLCVTLSNTPGALAGAARLLADAGVNVEYAYAAAVEGGTQALVVFGVSDAQRAASAAGF
jgi:hypothetical protein